jgi:hypothetical protein
MSLEDIKREATQTLGGPAGQGAAIEGEFIGAEQTDDQKKEEEAKEWAGVPFVLGGLLSRALPELKEVYTEAACLDWGRATVPVARKYGWSLGRFNAEIVWIGATWGMVAPAFDALKKRRAADAKPKEKQPGPATASGEAAPAGATHPDGSPVG